MIVHFLGLKGVLIDDSPAKQSWEDDAVPPKVVSDLFLAVRGEVDPSAFITDEAWQRFLAVANLRDGRSFSLRPSADVKYSADYACVVSRGTAAHPLDDKPGEQAENTAHFPRLLRIAFSESVQLANDLSPSASCGLIGWGQTVSFRFPQWLVHQHSTGGPFRRSGLAFEPVEQTAHKRCHAAYLTTLLEAFSLSFGTATDRTVFDLPEGADTISLDAREPLGLAVYRRSVTKAKWTFGVLFDTAAIVR